MQKVGASFYKGAEIITKKLAFMPTSSGVYRMLDKNGKVLYVGKAKNLKKRIVNYTRAEGLSDRIRLMVSLTADMVIVTTKTEAEAFLLENELIKNLKPYFNILLKDDKSFPFILITEEEYPRILKYRGEKKLKGDYFGPFTSVLGVEETIKSLRKAFGIRTCKNSVFNNRSRPCLLYQIKQCSGSCTGLINAKEYKQDVQQAKDFLRGKSAEIQEKMANEMRAFSDKQEYEKAAEVRDKIKALNSIQSQNSVNLPADLKIDIIAIYQEKQNIAIEVFFIRFGFSFGNKAFYYFNLPPAITKAEVLENFIGQFYEKEDIPDELIITDELPNQLTIASALGVKINTKPIAVRKRLLENALLNAKSALERKKAEKATDDSIYAQLADLVGLTFDTLTKIEVYDNSHIQGTNATGVMIVADNSGFKKNLYRRFNIRAEDYTSGDDIGMMKEVLERRLTRGIQENNLPALMIIDGGRTQLKAVLWAFYKQDITLEDVKLIGIAKGEKHDGGDETLFIPVKNGEEFKSVKLGKSSPLLFYIERLRDEAHRFAIGTHRTKRANSAKRNPLDEIEDIGKIRKQNLLQHFGSAKAVASASVEEISKVKGISKEQAEKIYCFFH